jgi:hypothetical protein
MADYLLLVIHIAPSWEHSQELSWQEWQCASKSQSSIAHPKS